MRVEYSAVIAKAMGFEYRYPLLYPKLVDFCFRLPATMKRQKGVARYVVRRYLEKHAPSSVYTKQQKAGGIIPATLDKCYQYLAEGRFNHNTQKAPYLDKIVQTTPHHLLIATINSYMLNYALENK